jgi:hypothetical protein
LLDRVTVPFVRGPFPEVRLLVGCWKTEKRFHLAIYGVYYCSRRFALRNLRRLIIDVATRCRLVSSRLGK